MPSVVGQITKGAVFDVLVDADAVGGDGGANTLPADTIADETITYAKMQHVSATDRFLGRDTAGAGDIEEITAAAARTILNVADGANVVAAAVVADNAVIRGDGGARGVQDSTVTIADNGVMSVPGIGDGGLTNYDLNVGDTTTPDYGMVRFGNAVIGRTSYNVGNIDLDGAILIRNIGGPVTSEIEVIFTESVGNTARFALAKSGAGNATYCARSMLMAGPAPADTDFVKVSYWQAQGIFHNLVCDTAGDGADLGVQNDLEVEGDIFVDSILESTTDAGVTIDGVLIKDGAVDGVDISAHVADTVDPHGATMTVNTRLNTQEVFGTSVLGLTASSASIDTVVVISNDDGTKEASLSVEKDITLGGTVDGVTVNAHAGRHVPGGADILQMSATDKLLGRSTAGAGNVEEIACTAAGRALIDDADTAAQRTTLDVFDQSTAIALAVAL